MKKMPATPKQTASGKRLLSKGDQAFRFCMRLFWMGVLVAALMVAIWVWLAGVDAMQYGLAAAKPYFAAWRLFLFTILIGGWRHWIDWLARWAELDARRKQDVLAQRWRTAAWLLMIEALLVQGVAGEFIRNILGYD